MTYDEIYNLFLASNHPGADLLKRTMYRMREDLDIYERRFGHLGPHNLDASRQINENSAKETLALQVHNFMTGEAKLSPVYVTHHAYSGETWAIAECLKQVL